MQHITTQNLSPAEIHQLSIQASKESQTISEYQVCAARMKQALCENMKLAHDLIDAGNHDQAKKIIMQTVANTYNTHSSVRTASNTQWLFNMYVEATGRAAKAKSLFYPHLVTAEDLIQLEEYAREDAIAYEDSQQVARQKRNGRKKSAVKEVVAC